MKKRMVFAGLVVCAVVGLCVGLGAAARAGKSGGDGAFALYVAPAVLVESAPCPWVTLHTDVAFGSVSAASVAVDGQDVAVDHVYADSRGNAVVKLKFADVTAVAAPPSATVALTLVVGDESLTAGETVVVRD